MSQKATKPAAVFGYETVFLTALRRMVTGVAREMTADSFDQLMEKLYQAVDHMTGGLLQRDPPAKKLACAKGCATCCHLHVEATEAELVYLAGHLRLNWSADDLTALKKRLSVQVSEIQSLSAAERPFAEVPCVLLKNGSCSAYEVRPLACRSATSTDADNCHAALEDPNGVSIPGYAHQRAIGSIANQALTLGLADAGIPNRNQKLMSGLQTLLDKTNPQGSAQS